MAASNHSRETSGRSTPQMPARINAEREPLKEPLIASEATNAGVERPNDLKTKTDIGSVTEMLKELCASTTNQAVCQIAKDQAEARARQCDLEFDSSQGQFASFPAVKERRDAAREAARADLLKKKKKLSALEETQSRHIDKLATVISQATSTEYISRAEHAITCAALEDENAILKKELMKLDAKIVAKYQALATKVEPMLGVATEVLTTKDQVATLESNLTQRFDALKLQYEELKGTATGVSQLLQRLDQLEADRAVREPLNKALANGVTVQQSATHASSEIAAVKEELASRFGTLQKELEEREKLLFDHFESEEAGTNQRLESLETASHDRSLEVITIRQDLKSLQETYDELRLLGASEASLKAVVTTLGEKISTMQVEVDGLKERVRQTSPHIAINGQQAALQGPVRSQSVYGSNESAHTSAAPSPTSSRMNGLSHMPHSLVCGHGAANGFNPPNAGIEQEVRNLSMQLNGLVIVTQQLKARYDNLLTDDIVRAMLEQWVQLNPKARNFEGVIAGIVHKIDALKADCIQAQLRTNLSMEEVKATLREASTPYKDAVMAAREVTAEFVARAASKGQDASIVDLQSRVTDMSAQLKDVRERLNSAVKDVDIAQQNTLNNSTTITELQKNVDSLSGRADEQSITVQQAISDAQAGMTAIEDQLAACSGTIEGLRSFVLEGSASVAD